MHLPSLCSEILYNNIYLYEKRVNAFFLRWLLCFMKIGMRHPSLTACIFVILGIVDSSVEEVVYKNKRH